MDWFEKQAGKENGRFLTIVIFLLLTLVSTFFLPVEGFAINNYDYYIYSAGKHWLANCSGGEKSSSGNEAGDQKGNGDATAGEYKFSEWGSGSYNSSGELRRWHTVFRYPDKRVALKIAQLGIDAVLNDHIGYDQGERETYWNELLKTNYNPSAISTDCETDCSAAVCTNIKAAGYLYNIVLLQNLKITDTYNMTNELRNAGFEVLTDSKYISQRDYLLPGDILLCEGHTVTNLTVGSKAAWGRKLTINIQGYGTVTGAESGNFIPEGESVCLQAEPDTGFVFTKWTLSGVPNKTESSEKTLDFNMPDNEVTVNAEFVHSPAMVAWGWSNLKVDSVTQNDAVVSASFYYGLPLGSIDLNAKPNFYLFSGTTQDTVLSAKPDSYAGAHMVNLGKIAGTAAVSMYERNYALKSNSLASNYCWLTPGQTFYYKWVAVHNNRIMESPVSIGQAKGLSATWSNLHTNDASYGLFNAQVNWDKNLTMNEVGCFVSTDRSKVEGATRRNANGCAVKKDVGGIAKVSSLATADTYGTIAFYRGPSFDTITSFTSGTTYYYKFYSLTSDGVEAYSSVASYTPGGAQSTNPVIKVQPGVYIIHSAWDDNMCLDIAGNSTEVNANIQLYHRVFDDVQKFSVIQADDQYYFVKSVYNSLWLDAKTPLGNNSNVKLYNTNTGTENYWFFEDAGNGYVYIRNKSGYYLDVQGDSAVDHANIQLYEFVGNNSQKWRLEESVDSWIVLAERSFTFKFNGADAMVAREEPDGTSNEKKTYNLGDPVKINQIIRNKYNNIWYRTVDGFYVYDRALDYAEDSGEVVSSEIVDLYLKVKAHETEPMYENRVPFGCWINPVQHAVGDTVHVVKRIHNGVGNIWYKTDAGKYIWQGVVDEDTDLQLPEIAAGKISQCSTDSFSVTCSFMDNQGLRNIQLGVWNDVAGIENAKWQSIDVTGKNVSYTFKIDLKQFGNQVNTFYHANAFAFDVNGNRSEAFRAADILIETERPEVTIARIENITSKTYEVVCKATDNGTVHKLRIGTWHDEMSIDDAVWQESEAFTDEARFYVCADYFGSVTDVIYHTNVYAIDLCGNVSTAVRAGDVYMVSSMSDANYTMPAQLSIIEESAFMGNEMMTIVDARNCYSVGRWAFMDTGLTRIRLPKDCDIHEEAFDDNIIYIFAPDGGTTKEYCDNHDNIVFIAE